MQPGMNRSDPDVQKESRPTAGEGHDPPGTGSHLEAAGTVHLCSVLIYINYDPVVLQDKPYFWSDCPARFCLIFQCVRIGMIDN